MTDAGHEGAAPEARGGAPVEDHPRLPRGLALCFAAALLGACGAGERFEPPHVLVVTIDTLRSDHLGCYGYFRNTSPVLDELAARSMVFERCLTPVAQTLPTHTSLFTGLYPYEHGILANRKGERVYVPASGAQTFAEAMARAGYETAAFVAAEPVKREGGLAEGFETWWEPEGTSVTADVVIEQALAWLERPRARPVYLWVHVFDPHALYQPPPPYDRLFETGTEQAAHLAARAFPERTRSHQLTTEAHNLYDGEIRFADEQLGRLFAHFAATGDFEDMLVAVTSDHGEGLAQHDFTGHGHIWLEQLSVPCILKAPGLGPGRSAVLMSSVDILPTLVARVPGLRARVRPWLDQATGRDVLVQEAPVAPVFGQFPANRRVPGSSIVDGKWRLILENERAALFDLELDPHELLDVAGDHPDVVAALRAELAAAQARQRARGAALGAGREAALPGDRRAGLEGLGYAGAEEDDE